MIRFLTLTSQDEHCPGLDNLCGLPDNRHAMRAGQTMIITVRLDDYSCRVGVLAVSQALLTCVQTHWSTTFGDLYFGATNCFIHLKPPSFKYALIFQILTFVYKLDFKLLLDSNIHIEI